MLDQHDDYKALDVETLGARLGALATVRDRLGGEPASWRIREVGDGNLNLVFIVDGTDQTLVIKQALPYVRLVGDSWPLPLTRAYFEFHALTRQARRDEGVVPEVFHFEESQALIAMQYLEPHTILRGKLIAGERVEGLARTLGRFCARTAFRGSDLSLPTAERKADAALFLGNVALCGITEDLIYTDPYFDADMNHHTAALDPVVQSLREDVALKTTVQRAMLAFASQSETLCHGDLHTGSIMCTDSDTRVIDPEFAFYGPFGFDLGMLLANFIMAYLSQPAHRDTETLEAYQQWIGEVIVDTVRTFDQQFAELWHGERTGILYPHVLFEDQGHSTEAALADIRVHIWQDALAVCGIEMHRRTLSLAHNADFETIEDQALKASLEARNLLLGRHILLDADNLSDVDALLASIQSFNQRECL